jgi:hypothetical protein
MSLFKECIEALGKYACITEKNIAEEILVKFDKDFPLTSWGRINWNEIEKSRIISSIEKIIPMLQEEKKNTLGVVYIIGSDPKIPIIESKLDKILEFFDDVEAMSPNSWFYCPSDGWVVEVYHDGEITLGFI